MSDWSRVEDAYRRAGGLGEPELFDVAERLDQMSSQLAAETAKNARLRAALEMVEWTWRKQPGGYEVRACPWCLGWQEHMQNGMEFGEGHTPDCPRQLALKEG